VERERLKMERKKGGYDGEGLKIVQRTRIERRRKRKKNGAEIPDPIEGRSPRKKKRKVGGGG
jgi:hypothetical protein